MYIVLDRRSNISITAPNLASLIPGSTVERGSLLGFKKESSPLKELYYLRINLTTIMPTTKPTIRRSIDIGQLISVTVVV
jgi:hypothetical protein